MLGALLALGSAAFFGLNNAAVRRGVLKGTVFAAMAITVPIGVPIFVVLALLMGGFDAMAAWDVAAWFWMALAGVVHFVFGRYGNYRATQALGATLSTPVQQVSILVALVLAFLFLGESVTAMNVAGILLVIAAPMSLVRRRRAAEKAGKSKGFEPRYAPGILWGTVGAVGYGTSPLFVALGIGEGGIPDSVGGVLVSYVAASVVVLAVLAVAGRGVVGAMDRETTGWFVASGLFVAVSQFFRYAALAVAPVTVVTPIQRLSVVFRLIFNAIINREHEVFDRWVVAAILVSMIGAVALAVETEVLLGWLGIDAPGLATPLF